MADSKPTDRESAASRSTSARIVVKLVCAAVISGLILWAIGDFVTDSRNSITGNTMRDFYSQERIDILFLGSSTVYESCVPSVFDAGTGMSSFNAATPAQTLRDSYYQLKEACRLYEPRRALLGLSPQHVMEPIERDSLSASYLFENMRWSPVKVGFMANAFDPDYYPSALFRIVRLRSELTAEDMKAAVQARASDDFEQDGQAQNGGSDGLRYVGKGYVANLQAIEDGTFPEAPPLGFSGPASASADALAYLSKIIAFCSEKGIELTLFQTPLLPGATEWVGDYAAYHDFIKGSADDAGVVFIDFNYLKPEIITYEDGMFSDLEHATESFAQRFSFVFAGLVAGGNGKTVSDGSFFTSYDTYRGLYNAVASTWVTEATDRGARVSSVGTATPEYRVAVLTDDDNMDTVRSVDWQTDDEAEFFPLKPGDYIVTVEARPRGDEDAAPKGNWVEIHVD